MSEQTPPVVEKPKSMDEAYARLSGQTPPAAAPVEAAPPPPPARKSVKVKLDHEEQEIDESWFADEEKSKRLKETYEKGYGSDRRVARERDEAAKVARADTARQYREWLASHGYETVQDATHPSGWKLVSKQVAMTAKDTAEDPLAKEEADLNAKIEAAEIVDPKWLRRLGQIDAIRAKDDALKSWRAEQAATEQSARAVRDAEAHKTQSAKIQEEAEKWVLGETDKFIAARAKSFEGPDSDRRGARIRSLALAAATKAASRGEDAIAAARAVVFEEADDLDARVNAWRGSLGNPPAKPEAPPVVGVAPGGGASSKPKNIDDAYAMAEARLAARR